MSSHTIEDLTSSILDFQANIVRVTFRRKTTIVDPEQDMTQEATVRFIWSSSKLPELFDNGEVYRWRRLGFASEDLRKEFAEVGLLGLDCLVCGTLDQRSGPDINATQEKLCSRRSRLFRKSVP